MNRQLLLATAVLVLAGAGCRANQQYLCRSRQAEAKVTLASVLTAQKTYFVENNRYASTIADLKLAQAPRYYDVKIEAATATSFTATATGKNEVAGDVWSVTESSTAPLAKVDKCAR